MKIINPPSTAIKTWAPDDRPREKMMLKGPESLSHSELLAILLNNGNKGQSALDIAREIMKLGQGNLQELGRLSLKELQQVKGVGPAKAITLMAALELGRRRLSLRSPERITIRSSKDIADYLKNLLQDHNHEVFAIVFLNRANRIKHFEIISKGGITGTVADPRIILKKALEAEATAIVLTHNHPSGNLQPSRADEEITRKIKQAAELFDITVLDHIIVSEDGYYSFADEGRI
jgi:DNA repair protein RadC